MAQNRVIEVRGAQVTAQVDGDGRVTLRFVDERGCLSLALSVAELTMLFSVVQDSIIGGDGCGQWRASQAHWGWRQERWLCPRCGQVLTFPF